MKENVKKNEHLSLRIICEDYISETKDHLYILWSLDIMTKTHMFFTVEHTLSLALHFLTLSTLNA